MKAIALGDEVSGVQQRDHRINARVQEMEEFLP